MCINFFHFHNLAPSLGSKLHFQLNFSYTQNLVNFVTSSHSRWWKQDIKTKHWPIKSIKSLFGVELKGTNFSSSIQHNWSEKQLDIAKLLLSCYLPWLSNNSKSHIYYLATTIEIASKNSATPMIYFLMCSALFTLAFPCVLSFVDTTFGILKFRTISSADWFDIVLSKLFMLLLK